MMAAHNINFAIGAEFPSLSAFKERLREYENENFVNFSVATSNKLQQNIEISEEVSKTLHYKYARFECKQSGQPRVKVTEEDRLRKGKTFKQGCESMFTIGTRKKADGLFVLCILSLNENHNHKRSKNMYKSMPKQRLDVIKNAEEYLQQVVNISPNFQLLQNQLSSEQGVVKRRDIYNFKNKQREESAAIGQNDLEKIVHEMTGIEGASVRVFHNDENNVEAILFQDKRMKAYFDNYADLLMFDGTYSLNDRRMPLIVLLVVDGNGESQIVALIMVKSENAETFNLVFDCFKQENPNHILTRVIVTDKHCANVNVIANQFPNAAHHLCIFHVMQIFQREITTRKRSITHVQRQICLNILKKMLYAENQEQYDEQYIELMDLACPRK